MCKRIKTEIEILKKLCEWRENRIGKKEATCARKIHLFIAEKCRDKITFVLFFLDNVLPDAKACRETTVLGVHSFRVFKGYVGR